MAGINQELSNRMLLKSSPQGDLQFFVSVWAQIRNQFEGANGIPVTESLALVGRSFSVIRSWVFLL